MFILSLHFSYPFSPLMFLDAFQNHSKVARALSTGTLLSSAARCKHGNDGKVCLLLASRLLCVNSLPKKQNSVHTCQE